MAKLDILLDRVLDEYPSVPQALALRALSDAAKEFCSRSQIWQESLAQIALRPGEVQYEVSLDTGTQLVRFVEVRLDGRKIDPAATEILRLRTSPLRAGLPQGYVQWEPSVIELVNPPQDAARLDVKAALTLGLNATGVNLPDSLLDEHGEAIASGAKARLVRQRGQEWFDPAAIQLYAGPFYSAVNAAKSRATNALGDAEVQVQMRRW